MIVYKSFFSILNKQKGQVLLYFCIFMAIAYIIAGTYASDDRKMKWVKDQCLFAVFDEDGTVASRAVTHFLSTYHSRVVLPDQEENIQDELYEHNVNAVLRIPKGFGQSLENGIPLKIQITDIPGSQDSVLFRNDLSNYMKLVKAYITNGESISAACEYADEMCKLRVPVQLKEKEVGKDRSRLYCFVSYLPYIYISICISAIGPTIITFRRRAIMDRNQCSSTSVLRMNLGIFAGMVTAGMVILLISIFLVLIGNGRSFLNFSGVLYCINMFSFLWVALGLTFLIGQFTTQVSSLTMISNVIGLGMSFLSGVFVQLDQLDQGVVRLAHFMPMYWYVKAAKYVDYYQQGDSLAVFWTYLLIQLLFAVAIVCCGLAYSKTKQSR
ncbi:MAG: ABC transporter permease [Eubacteriales bacterium]|nr:ABC transporter permease [Eubacteriales bacterium]